MTLIPSDADPRTRSTIVAVSWIVWVVATVVAAAGAWWYMSGLDQMEWDCGGGSCATDDVRGAGFAALAFGLVVACFAGAVALRATGVGLSLLCCGLTTVGARLWAIALGYSTEIGGLPAILGGLLTAFGVLATAGGIVSGIRNARFRRRVAERLERNRAQERAEQEGHPERRP